jgi:hypothetical protein
MVGDGQELMGLSAGAAYFDSGVLELSDRCGVGDEGSNASRGGFVVMVGINRFHQFHLFETVVFCYDPCTPFAMQWSMYGFSRSKWKPSCDKMETDEGRDGKSDRMIGSNDDRMNEKEWFEWSTLNGSS